MKKLILFLNLFIVSMNMGFSQDTIYTNSDQIILVKVIEVKTQELKYKRFDNPDGPIYSMDILDINKVVYENGSVEIFYKRASKTEKASWGDGNAHFILHGGATFSKLREETKSTKLNPGFSAGGTFELPISLSWKNHVDFTFLYEQKGTKYNDYQFMVDDKVYESFSETVTMDYITFSVSYKRYLGNVQRFYIRAGVYGGYLYQAKLKADIKVLETGKTYPIDVPIKEYFTQYDIGGTVGFGLKFPLKNLKFKSDFVFDARYNIGFKNINKESSTANILTSDFLVLIGFRFPF